MCEILYSTGSSSEGSRFIWSEIKLLWDLWAFNYRLFYQGFVLRYDLNLPETLVRTLMLSMRQISRPGTRSCNHPSRKLNVYRQISCVVLIYGVLPWFNYLFPNRYTWYNQPSMTLSSIHHQWLGKSFGLLFATLKSIGMPCTFGETLAIHSQRSPR